MPTLDFYFDYLSPYAYLAWRQLPALAARHGAELRLKPVLFAGLLGHWGQLGPAEIPPKRDFVFKDALRQAALLGLPFELPKLHPFNPLLSLRLSLPEVSGELQPKVVGALWSAGWGRGIDLSSPEELKEALGAEGLPAEALLAKTSEPAVKEALKRETDQAIAKGVFGVPTLMVGDDLFWGSDRLHLVELALEGRDPLDREKAKEMLSRYRGSSERLKRKPPQQ